MATMKDVAKLAKVSHGTVSNVINGVKGVSLEKVKRVESAMSQLGYKPNGVARNLKLKKTMQIDVIIPNIIDASLSQIYTNILMRANERGYTANLQITNQDPELETKYLNNALMYNKDGVILMTCQPNNSALFKSLTSNGLKIIFIATEPAGIEHNFVGFDGKPTIERTLKQLFDKNYLDVAIITGPLEYTFESQLLDGYAKAHRAANRTVTQAYCGISGYDRETTIKEAFRILAGKAPQAIIATCHQMVNAILIAMELLNISPEEKPLLVALVPYSWSLTKTKGVLYVSLPYTKIAEAAFNLLMDVIHSPPGMYTKKIIQLKNPPSLFTEQPRAKASKDESIRVLLNDDQAAHATKTLLPEFESRTGIKVHIETRDYHEMYESLKREWYKDNYDVFGIDIPWLPELAQKNVLENLDGYAKNNDDTFEEIINDFAIQRGSVFAAPYTICTQQLFYRKDIFADTKIQRLYYEKNKKELLPPRNWQEFNTAARFFTRRFNSESPTTFGTTLGSRMSSGAVCEYLPRLWAFGGSIYENSVFTLNSETAVAALENYKESFQYAPPGSCDNWWSEQVAQFSHGDVAMMVLFADQASDVTVRSKSNVNGKIGYADIPGQVGILGGWSMAINACSRNKSNAFAFMEWACSKEMAVMTTILGGCVPCQTAVEDFEVSTIYPWLRKNIEVKRNSKSRKLSSKLDGTEISEHAFEDILGEAVYKTVTDQTQAKTALESANAKLNQLL